MFSYQFMLTFDMTRTKDDDDDDDDYYLIKQDETDEVDAGDDEEDEDYGNGHAGKDYDFYDY